MKDKATAIVIALAVIFLVPVIASLTWLVLGAAAGYVLWHRKQFEKIWTDMKDVVGGGGSNTQ